MKNPDLFSALAEERQKGIAPLAARCRPRSLDDFEGQSKILNPRAPVRRWLKNGQIPSLILWGPPGSGKTSFARILGESLSYRFVEMSAAAVSVSDFKKLFAEVKDGLSQDQRRVLLFVDEIHRLTKVQQDALLAGVEEGLVTLVGVTTENPQYAVSRALLSRSQVLQFDALENVALKKILTRGLERSKSQIVVSPETLDSSFDTLIMAARGDARRALNLLEMILMDNPEMLAHPDQTASFLKDIDAHKAFLGLDDEIHYRFISDYIKAMRRGDETVAMDRLARLLSHGEDPLFIARRLVIFAAEDVGLASPQLLPYVNAIFDSIERVGMPESRISLAAGTLAACRAKKSREAYESIEMAMQQVASAGDKVPT